MITLKDLKEWVTLKDLLDIHEAMDLKDASYHRSQGSK